MSSLEVLYAFRKGFLKMSSMVPDMLLVLKESVDQEKKGRSSCVIDRSPKSRTQCPLVSTGVPLYVVFETHMMQALAWYDFLQDPGPLLGEVTSLLWVLDSLHAQ